MTHIKFEGESTRIGPNTLTTHTKIITGSGRRETLDRVATVETTDVRRRVGREPSTRGQ